MENTGGLIVYSSKTGNTRKLAQGILKGLEDRGVTARIAPVEEKPDGNGADWVLLGFWVDRGNADGKARRYLKGLSGQQVGFFGTLGAYPDSDHARESAARVRELAEKKNTFLGCFLCQGKIDPKLTALFSKLPKGHPHGMNEERRKRHEEAAKHPDDADIAAAAEACAEMIKNTVKKIKAG
ncbi:MAG: flavodoxin family protein [Treponema sp.]|jgi:flavodoxin|nr:flavodoxin family protein [Treponema sp.]